MSHDPKKVLDALESALKVVLKQVGGDGGVTTVKQQLETLEFLKSMPENRMDHG